MDTALFRIVSGYDYKCYKPCLDTGPLKNGEESGRAVQFQLLIISDWKVSSMLQIVPNDSKAMVTNWPYNSKATVTIQAKLLKSYGNKSAQ